MGQQKSKREIRLEKAIYYYNRDQNTKAVEFAL